jgi:hypothetical protein
MDIHACSDDLYSGGERHCGHEQSDVILAAFEASRLV